MIGKCAVCSQTLVSGRSSGPGQTEYDVSTIRCGHLFHRKCLHDRLQTNTTCPKCRRPVAFMQTVSKLHFELDNVTSSAVLQAEIEALKAKPPEKEEIVGMYEDADNTKLKVTILSQQVALADKQKMLDHWKAAADDENKRADQLDRANYQLSKINHSMKQLLDQVISAKDAKSEVQRNNPLLVAALGKQTSELESHHADHQVALAQLTHQNSELQQALELAKEENDRTSIEMTAKEAYQLGLLEEIMSWKATSLSSQDQVKVLTSKLEAEDVNRQILVDKVNNNKAAIAKLDDDVHIKKATIQIMNDELITVKFKFGEAKLDHQMKMKALEADHRQALETTKVAHREAYEKLQISIQSKAQEVSTKELKKQASNHQMALMSATQKFKTELATKEMTIQELTKQASGHQLALISAKELSLVELKKQAFSHQMALKWASQNYKCDLEDNEASIEELKKQASSHQEALISATQKFKTELATKELTIQDITKQASSQQMALMSAKEVSIKKLKKQAKKHEEELKKHVLSHQMAMNQVIENYKCDLEANKVSNEELKKQATSHQMALTSATLKYKTELATKEMNIQELVKQASSHQMVFTLAKEVSIEELEKLASSQMSVKESLLQSLHKHIGSRLQSDRDKMINFEKKWMAVLDDTKAKHQVILQNLAEKHKAEINVNQRAFAEAKDYHKLEMEATTISHQEEIDSLRQATRDADKQHWVPQQQAVMEMSAKDALLQSLGDKIGNHKVELKWAAKKYEHDLTAKEKAIRKLKKQVSSHKIVQKSSTERYRRDLKDKEGITQALRKLAANRQANLAKLNTLHQAQLVAHQQSGKDFQVKIASLQEELNAVRVRNKALIEKRHRLCENASKDISDVTAAQEKACTQQDTVLGEADKRHQVELRALQVQHHSDLETNKVLLQTLHQEINHQKTNLVATIAKHEAEKIAQDQFCHDLHKEIASLKEALNDTWREKITAQDSHRQMKVQVAGCKAALVEAEERHRAQHQVARQNFGAEIAVKESILKSLRKEFGSHQQSNRDKMINAERKWMALLNDAKAKHQVALENLVEKRKAEIIVNQVALAEAEDNHRLQMEATLINCQKEINSVRQVARDDDKQHLVAWQRAEMEMAAKDALLRSLGDQIGNHQVELERLTNIHRTELKNTGVLGMSLLDDLIRTHKKTLHEQAKNQRAEMNDNKEIQQSLQAQIDSLQEVLLEAEERHKLEMEAVTVDHRAETDSLKLVGNNEEARSELNDKLRRFMVDLIALHKTATGNVRKERRSRWDVAERQAGSLSSQTSEMVFQSVEALEVTRDWRMASQWLRDKEAQRGTLGGSGPTEQALPEPAEVSNKYTPMDNDAASSSRGKPKKRRLIDWR